jgi:hypothetical protein
MTFETKLLDSVNKMLTPGDRARFVHGRLHVRCSEIAANKIFDSLSYEYKDTKVTLTKWITATEFAFDFA